MDDDPVYAADNAPVPPTFPFSMPYWGSMGVGGAAGLPIENLRGKGRANPARRAGVHLPRWQLAARGRRPGRRGRHLRCLREGQERRREARVLRDRDDVVERADVEAGRHHEVHPRDQLQAGRGRTQTARLVTPEELSDRAEIHDVIVRYGWAIDTKDWTLLDSCFTEDAHVDYSSNPGGKVGPYREVRGWLEKVMSAFPVTQHLMANIDVTLDGDRRRAARWSRIRRVPRRAGRAPFLLRRRSLRRRPRAHRRRLEDRQTGRDDAVVPGLAAGRAPDPALHAAAGPTSRSRPESAGRATPSRRDCRPPRDARPR